MATTAVVAAVREAALAMTAVRAMVAVTAEARARAEGYAAGGGSSQQRRYIRSSIMSHIIFKMCPFVLIIYLRDYQYDFDLDIVVLWSCYGVLRLTYTTYQNLCPTDHFFGRLLMSQDISPTWIVLLESIYRIIQVYFRISPLSKIVL